MKQRKQQTEQHPVIQIVHAAVALESHIVPCGERRLAKLVRRAERGAWADPKLNEEVADFTLGCLVAFRDVARAQGVEDVAREADAMARDFLAHVTAPD